MNRLGLSEYVTGIVPKLSGTEFGPRQADNKPVRADVTFDDQVVGLGVANIQVPVGFE